MALIAPTGQARRDTVGRPAALFLLVGGIGFFAGGGLHPKDDGHGDKLAQLHSMLVSDAWYPAHLILLLGMTGFAAGIVALRGRGGTPVLDRLLSVSAVVAVVAAIGAVVHLFAATQATAIADGSSTLLVEVFTGVETVVNPVWGVMIAILAAVGGVTRTVGNRLVAPLGVVGGLAYALAVATIAFTDTFDALFPVGSLLGVWAVAVAVTALSRRSTGPSAAPNGSPDIHPQIGSPKGR